MPHVHITWLEGRTHEQKRKVVERITKVLEEEAGTRLEKLRSRSWTFPPSTSGWAGCWLPTRSARRN